ncbi:hypothetical protein JRO89_XS15G0182100 [Xanthoceras sorbifolium]|uniref:Uncharacterized protein n=1 Tax=Xanthoceras sorbifolium TaxID=99658 RepID=A0ABQ8H2X8_9ROSI|nr:hypothetical protein JRO89_XS15G0182100 [Xanthoceras sorbifolium]
MKKQWPVRALSRALSSSTSSSTTRSCSTTTSFPLKHVTKSNFDSALSSLSDHVRAADFVAIDLEMTGVTSAPWRDSFEFDRFDVRYLKVKDSAEKFAVVQFGVCPFRWDPLKLSFVAHPHNFFIFPRQELPFGCPANEFLCQTTSLDFLAKYQFDFNACIHEGVSYLSREQESEALKHANLLYKDGLSDEWHSLKEARDTPVVNVVDVLFSERMKNRLSEWRGGLLRETNGGSEIRGSLNGSEQQFQTVFFKMRPAVSLNGFTSHQLRLIQLVVKKHFKDLTYLSVSGENSSQQLVVYVDSESDKRLLMKEVKDEQCKQQELKIKAAVGFRHVIDLLSSEKKLIVGHNCFLDIAHIYSKFLGPLPLTGEEFASSVNKYFPYIIDTKILLNSNNVLQHWMKKSSTSLSSAFAVLCPQMALGTKSSYLPFQSRVKVEVEVDDMRSSNWNSGAKHEAGYDAFMTGCIFAQACSHLGIDFKLHSPSENLAHNEKIQKHINCLYLSWINGDIINLSTGNRTSESFSSNNHKMRHAKICFEHVVLIWGFQSKLKAREIRECITKVLGPISVTSVYHVDETAVFVLFSKAELVSKFLVLKESLERSNDPISVLHPLAKLLEGGNTRASSYETYKEICSSPISKVLFADQAEAVGIKWKTKLVETKVEATKNHHVGNSMNPDSGSAQETNNRKVNKVTIDSSFNQLSQNEIVDSYYSSKDVQQLRTSNL